MGCGESQPKKSEGGDKNNKNSNTSATNTKVATVEAPKLFLDVTRHTNKYQFNPLALLLYLEYNKAIEITEGIQRELNCNNNNSNGNDRKTQPNTVTTTNHNTHKYTAMEVGMHNTNINTNGVWTATRDAPSPVKKKSAEEVTEDIIQKENAVQYLFYLCETPELAKEENFTGERVVLALELFRGYVEAQNNDHNNEKNENGSKHPENNNTKQQKQQQEQGKDIITMDDFQYEIISNRTEDKEYLDTMLRRYNENKDTFMRENAYNSEYKAIKKEKENEKKKNNKEKNKKDNKKNKDKKKKDDKHGNKGKKKKKDKEEEDGDEEDENCEHNNKEEVLEVGDAVLHLYAKCNYSVRNSYTHFHPWEAEIRLCFLKK